MPLQEATDLTNPHLAQERYIQAMEHLIGVVQQLSLVKDIDAIVEIVCQSARQLTGADGATFVMRDGELSYYINEDAIGPLWKGKRFPINACIGGWCILHGETVTIADVFNDERVPGEVYEPTFVKSLVMVPILEAAPIGAIGNYWATGHLATQEEIKLLQSLANASSIAIGRIQAEQKNREQAAILLRVQRLESIGTLASGIAHDLNNIFTPILATSQLLPLQFPDLDPRTRQLLDLLKESAQRGANLVQQILSFGRGTEGQKVPLQVGHLLLEVNRVAQQTFPKAIDISASVSTKELWTVLADPTQLHQVLMNLCVNARDAMPNGGTLTIAAENCAIDETYAQMNVEAKVGSYVMITVSDTGTGIAPEVLNRIFDPFFTTKDYGKGTGLGLSTVLGIVKHHEGWVNVYSELGKGTVFKVYLPTSAETISATGESGELQLGDGEVVLLVEDEALVRRSTQTALENHNYKIVSANDGIEAIALYARQSQEINVVLMDLMMPTMDGFTALRTLKKLNPEVRIIATSGLGSNRKRLENAEAEVEAFLPKPYTVTQLLTVLHEVLH
jgi:signal transduction histidine kinase